jgi:predicted adenine nucleotide alpha hydrolase (AANH) superfamily ATPase
VEWLCAHEIEPIIFYFNPNIYPQEEYEIRKAESKRHAESLGIQWIDGDEECQMSDVGCQMLDVGCQMLDVGCQMLDVGCQMLDVHFWAQNWRKDGLQERRNALLKEYAFYNQQYCGCEFSMRSTK